jgi:hypothetical protein
VEGYKLYGISEAKEQCVKIQPPFTFLNARSPAYLPYCDISQDNNTCKC